MIRMKYSREDSRYQLIECGAIDLDLELEDPGKHATNLF